MRTRRRLHQGLVAAAAATTLVVPVGASAVAAVPAGATETADATRGPTPGAGQRTVTLVTGDRVVVHGEGNDLRVIGTRPAPDRQGTVFFRSTINDRQYVVPGDTADLLSAGRLDRRLFDVTGLVEQGYDDGRRADLPLLFATDSGVSLRAGDGVMQSLVAAPNTANLSAFGMAAARAPKARLSAFWRSVRDQRGTASLRGGVTKILLDGQVRAALDQSVAQIGAPQAWQRGHTGAGVKVAVLDTGYDARHPDLAGVVAASANFTDEPDAADGNGHGTHVASTIAGTGAGSGGRYRGAAPGARLLVGKVLDSSGSGQESAILAGMQWAAEQGARVVNMSLGGGVSDGSDPLSQAVNELTERSGSLFVVAAGNVGRETSVGAPAAADHAFAVASVTKQDKLSVFSSRGPRPDNYGLKPEISAPGSGIVAARAHGTLSGAAVNERYASLDGTSMATPHVAGAAAILAGAHPQWTAQRLKAALMGTATPIAGTDVFGQGAGRVDVGRAVGQAVHAEPGGLSLGVLPWPHVGTPRTSTLTYHNDGGKPVTLRLRLTVTRRGGGPAPAGLVALGRESVTVPAHGSATVPVTVRPRAGHAGQYVGQVSADGGDATLTTPLTVEVQRATHTVTVRPLDRSGQPALANLVLQNEDTGYAVQGYSFGGVMQVSVPAGRYRLLGQIADIADGRYSAMTTFARRDLRVDRDVDTAVDARAGKPVRVGVDEPDARVQPGTGGHGVTSTVAGQDRSGTASAVFNGVVSMYTIGSRDMPGLSFVYAGLWQRPWVTLAVTGPDGYRFHDPIDNTIRGYRQTVQAPVVDVEDGSPERVGDVAGKIVMLGTDDKPPTEEELLRRIRALHAKGARLVLAAWYVAGVDELPVPVINLYHAGEFTRLRAQVAAGPVTIRAEGHRDSPYAYLVADEVAGRVPDGWVRTFRKRELGQLRTVYHNPRPGEARMMVGHLLSGRSIGGGLEAEVRLPQARTEYYSPGFTWQRVTLLGYDTADRPFGVEVDVPSTYRAGERRESHRYRAPFGPELTAPAPDRQDGRPLPWVHRQGDKVHVRVPMHGDSDPQHFGVLAPSMRGSTTLYRDGNQIGHNDVPGSGVFDVPAAAGTYRLVAEATTDVPDVRLGTRVSAEWTFGSRHTDPRHRTALPLLDVRVELPLDGNDTAPAARPLAGTVEVSSQSDTRSAAVRSLRVAASFDDGVSWQPVAVRSDGALWHIVLPAGGRPGGYVSLRMSASDRDGNAVTETMIRAYALG